MGFIERISVQVFILFYVKSGVSLQFTPGQRHSRGGEILSLGSSCGDATRLGLDSLYLPRCLKSTVSAAASVCALKLKHNLV